MSHRGSSEQDALATARAVLYETPCRLYRLQAGDAMLALAVGRIKTNQAEAMRSLLKAAT